jgi:hypothetical protein
MLTSSNYMTAQFKNSGLTAKIGVGASTENAQEMIYTVSITDQDYVEYFSLDFMHVEDAIDYCCQRFVDWEFLDLEEKNNSGSCSSCVAH